MSYPAATVKPRVDLYHPHLKTGRSALAVAGVFWSTLQTLIPTVSSAAVFIISAMFLSPGDFGLVGLATGLVMSIIAFSPLAFGEALVQRSALSRSHADSVFWLTAGFGLLCFVTLVFLSERIAMVVGHQDLAMILPVLAIRIPLDLAAAVPNAMIVRSMKFRLIALRTAVATLVSVTLCLAMLLAGYGYWALVASQLSASLVACVVAFWVCGWTPGISVGWSAIRELSSYGLFASGNRMLSTVRLDHLVLGALGGTALLGLFIFAQRLYNMLTQLIGGALSSVTLSLLSAMQGEAEKTAQAFGMASFAAAAISLPMFCSLAITAPDLLNLLLDDKWSDAAFAVQAFCAAGVMAGIGVVQAAFIKSQGRADWWFYYQLAQQVSSVVVIMLTYRFGLHMMMVALVAKSVLLWPVSVVMTARLLKCSPWHYLAWFRRPLIATLVMAFAMLIVPPLTPTLGTMVLCVVQFTVAAIIYVPLLLLLSRDRIAQLCNHLPLRRKPAA